MHVLKCVKTDFQETIDRVLVHVLLLLRETPAIQRILDNLLPHEFDKRSRGVLGTYSSRVIMSLNIAVISSLFRNLQYHISSHICGIPGFDGSSICIIHFTFHIDITNHIQYGYIHINIHYLKKLTCCMARPAVVSSKLTSQYYSVL